MLGVGGSRVRQVVSVVIDALGAHIHEIDARTDREFMVVQRVLHDSILLTRMGLQLTRRKEGETAIQLRENHHSPNLHGFRTTSLISYAPVEFIHR